jgi:POT family proton-dependent oligopeptide transporter
MFKNHPKGLLPAALSNMGERFGYYIMNAVLTLFLCSKFGLDAKTGALIYSFFYAGIYVLALVGGFIADRLTNYKGTIMTGLIIMACGYGLLSIPIMSTSDNFTFLLVFTCVSLFLIAFGNGLFKGNLQAIVGQMYDIHEKEAVQQGAVQLEEAKKKRDRGFQIFYVFINIGGLIAPFIAPILRGWWLGKHNLLYNADLPALCHNFLKTGTAMDPVQYENLTSLAHKVSAAGTTIDPSQMEVFCNNYLNIFNTGVHYSFIASVAAMLISLVIFISTKKIFPTPPKKEKKVNEEYTAEERKAMADEIKQRIFALFAVLGIVIFFWFSFHQNGVSLSYFARDFVNTSVVPPEIWQAINPFLVICLTPLIIWIFARMNNKKKKYLEQNPQEENSTALAKKAIPKGEPSTPMKIAIGMGIAGLGYLFLTIVSKMLSFPSYNEYQKMGEVAQSALKIAPWTLIIMYFFLTVAELFISPLGLSFVSKIAPKNMQGLCQGLWLTATALGNLLLFLGAMMYENWSLWSCWVVFAIVCAISMIVMLTMVRWIERIAAKAS